MTVGSIFGNAISALIANQKALATVSHNIANVNTQGYNRQRTDLVARLPQGTSAGFIGSGVEMASVRRITDEFVNAQLRSQTSLVEQYGMFHALMGPMDSILGDVTAGLSPALQGFFDAIDEVSADPSSPGAREVMLGSAASLVSRFNGLHGVFQDTHKEVDVRLRGLVAEVNNLAGAIADTNDAVLKARGQAPGQPPNDLLDRRDELIRRLAEITAVTTVQAGDGTLSVSIAGGQQLVLGSGSRSLEVVANQFDPSRLEISLGGGSPITDALQGGRLGGVLGFRDEALNPMINRLGQLAIGLGATFNAQHRLGLDLNSDFGGDFFQTASPRVLAHPNNAATGLPAVVIGDPTQITAADYQLGYDGAVWSLTDLASGQPVAMSGTGTTADPFVAVGLTIDVQGIGAGAGDRFLIQPTQSGAADIALLISDADNIAAALPVKWVAPQGNLGDTHISQLRVGDTAALPLSANGGDIILTFDPDALGAGVPGFVISGGPGGVIAYDPATEQNGKSFTLGAPFDGIEFSVAGQPAAGDTLMITDNLGGIGDNGNALLLNALRTEPILAGGKFTYSEIYNALVSDAAVLTRRAGTERDVQQGILDFTTDRRDSISGVNLDEEAADLLRYQQAYQAASQVIQAARELFQELLGAVRG